MSTANSQTKDKQEEFLCVSDQQNTQSHASFNPKSDEKASTQGQSEKIENLTEEQLQQIENLKASSRFDEQTKRRLIHNIKKQVEKNPDAFNTPSVQNGLTFTPNSTGDLVQDSVLDKLRDRASNRRKIETYVKNRGSGFHKEKQMFDDYGVGVLMMPEVDPPKKLPRDPFNFSASDTFDKLLYGKNPGKRANKQRMTNNMTTPAGFNQSSMLVKKQSVMSQKRMSEAHSGLPSIQDAQKRRAMPGKELGSFESRDLLEHGGSLRNIEFTPGKIRMAQSKAQSTHMLKKRKNSPDWVGQHAGMVSGVISKYKKPKYQRGAQSSLLMNPNNMKRNDKLYSQMKIQAPQKVGSTRVIDATNFDWDQDGHKHEKGHLPSPTPQSRHGMHGDIRQTPKSSAMLKRVPNHDPNELVAFDPNKSKLSTSQMSRRKKSNESTSLTKRLMSDLTNGQCPINEGTTLVINGSETLTVDGIKGKINKVGRGFGTARHLAGRNGTPPKPPQVIQKFIEEEPQLKTEKGCQMDEDMVNSYAKDYKLPEFTKKANMSIQVEMDNARESGLAEPNLPMPVEKHDFVPDLDYSPYPTTIRVAQMLEFTETEEEMKDWSDSHFYQFIYQGHTKVLAKRGQFNDPPSTPKSQRGMTAQQKHDHNLNPLKLDMLTYTEVVYSSEVLRDAPECQANVRPDKLEEIAEKAKTTIEVLVANMVNPMIMNQIFFKNYREINAENNLKLLFRAKKLFEAREQVATVLKGIVEIEIAMRKKERIWCILLDDKKDNKIHDIFKKEIDDLLLNISRTLTQIDSFKEQNKLFKGKFCFKGVEHSDTLIELSQVISGYLLRKGQEGVLLDKSGTMVTVENKKSPLTSLDIKAYENWHMEAVAVTGKLPLPSKEPVVSTQTDAKPKKSRIEAALKAMPPKRFVEELRFPGEKEITPLPSNIDADDIKSESWAPQPPKGSFPEWMLGEFDEDGNIVPYPGLHKDHMISPTSDLDRFRRKYMASIGEDEGKNVPSHPGYERAKIADTGPMYVKDEFCGTPNNQIAQKKAKEMFGAMPEHMDKSGDLPQTKIKKAADTKAKGKKSSKNLVSKRASNDQIHSNSKLDGKKNSIPHAISGGNTLDVPAPETQQRVQTSNINKRKKVNLAKDSESSIKHGEHNFINGNSKSSFTMGRDVSLKLDQDSNIMVKNSSKSQSKKD